MDTAAKSFVKKGRKHQPYPSSWGDPITGLARRPSDGRWRVVATGQTFSEPDERLAVARFFEITRGKGDDDMLIPRVDPHEHPPTQFEIIPTDGWQPSVAVNSRVFWAWLRDILTTRTKYVAKMTGLPKLAWFEAAEPPKESLKLATLIDIWAAKPGLSTEEVTRCRRMWEEFVAIVGVDSVREIEHEQIEMYEAKINAGELSPKSIKHRYGRVKTVVAYALKRGRDKEGCREALDNLAMLESPETDALNPEPITPEDFWAVHAKAIEAKDYVFATMMLFSLNSGMYPSEVGSVRWGEIDIKRGEFASRRNKTKVPRIAILWPEVVKELKRLPHDHLTVFNTIRAPYRRFSVFRDWTKYREAAGLPDVKFNQIRDASFSVACRVSADQARLLCGHRLPGAVDHYVLRNPPLVAVACDAIRAAYNVKRRWNASSRLPPSEKR